MLSQEQEAHLAWTLQSARAMLEREHNLKTFFEDIQRAGGDDDDAGLQQTTDFVLHSIKSHQVARACGREAHYLKCPACDAPYDEETCHGPRAHLSLPICNRCGFHAERDVEVDPYDKSNRLSDNGLRHVLRHSIDRVVIPATTKYWMEEDAEVRAERARGRMADARTTVEEPCPKCAHPFQKFWTAQLRSADEGMTVFYECLKCSNKYSINN
eukprot:GDKJ01048284.1.p1 GENE.GDKJ01048284.1~~GDKJ01048284.1.p1  ORF type:complete len:213 (-),score=36.79 GDKJ01048284.1:74-712(-)